MDAVEAAHRAQWARLLALLTAQLRNLDLAEESLAEAFAAAVSAWSAEVPREPAAWLLTAARRYAVDRMRREAVAGRKQPLLVVDEPVTTDEGIPDERLRLIFTCCHPALDLPARVALTLRCVGGLSTAEIARAFLVPEPTMAARITRAKKKIAAAGIPYRVPDSDERPDRVNGVLAVLYLVFNEGYSQVRADLCEEAIWLTRVLAGLLPGEAEPVALLALMLLQHSRHRARIVGGHAVTLAQQDRGQWDRAAIAEALNLLPRAGSGRYALEAGIAAEHAQPGGTDWIAVANRYAALEQLTPSPIVRLNRAVAVAEADGPAAGLALLDGLELPGYHLLPAVRADLWRRLGHRAQAAQEYRSALALATNPADRELLTARLAEL